MSYEVRKSKSFGLVLKTSSKAKALKLFSSSTEYQLYIVKG